MDVSKSRQWYHRRSKSEPDTRRRGSLTESEITPENPEDDYPKKPATTKPASTSAPASSEGGQSSGGNRTATAHNSVDPYSEYLSSYAARQDMQLSASTFDSNGSAQGQYHQQSGFNSGSNASTTDPVPNEVNPFYASSHTELPRTPYGFVNQSQSSDDQAIPEANAATAPSDDQAVSR